MKARSGPLPLRCVLAFAAVLPLAGCLDWLTDAATAIAYDIESGTALFALSGDATRTIRHVPKASRGGCADHWRVQFSRDSALVVWCWAPGSDTRAASSHSTTYHLRFVAVPETIIVDKQRGEPLVIDVAKGEGKPVVTAVR